jgi:hypothetical protein
MSRPMELPGNGDGGVAESCDASGGRPRAAMIAGAEPGTASAAQIAIRGPAAGAMAAAATTIGTTRADCCSAGTARIAAQAMTGACEARWGGGRAPMEAETTRGATASRWSLGSARTTSVTIRIALSGPPATISCAARRGASPGLPVTASIRAWACTAGWAGRAAGVTRRERARARAGSRDGRAPLGISLLDYRC